MVDDRDIQLTGAIRSTRRRLCVTDAGGENEEVIPQITYFSRRNTALARGQTLTYVSK